MKCLKKLPGKSFELGARGFLAAALTATVLGLAAAPAQAATVMVNTTVDQALGSCASSCSLRDAVATANPGDTVQIPAGTYVLTLGEITINKNLTLAGGDARSTVLDGNHASRIFLLTSGSPQRVELDDLSLINGLATTPVPGVGAVAGGALGGSFGPGGSLTLRNCQFAGSQAVAGGAIFWFGDLTIDQCTITGNLATSNFNGGGGGGILAGFGVLTITNSTLTGNTASASVGGGAALGFGGSVNLVNNTITANQAPLGGGLAVAIGGSMANTIIAANMGGDCFGAALSSGHNLDSDNTCQLTGPGDLPGVAPLLGPLADNGGPTDTHALLAGSPALDAGDNATCLATDQRGVPRPQRVVCDIGAVEMENVPPALTSAHASVTVNEGQTAANTGTVSDGNGDPVTLTASVGTVINNGDGTWSWSFLTSDGPTQSQTVTLSGDDGHGGTGITSFSLVVVNVAPTIVSVSNNGPVSTGSPATITVTATDPAGANDPLSYSFDCDNNGVFEIGPQAGNSAPCTFATGGSKTVNVQVTDGDGGTATGSTVVTVKAPPLCSAAVASPSKITLPLIITFVSVNVTGVTDPDGDPVTITITGIRQDEPVGLLHPDGTGVGSSTAHVRAEANLLLGLGGNGRVYHIGFTASDGKGGTCAGTVKVGVTLLGLFPAVDGGPLFDSTL